MPNRSEISPSADVNPDVNLLLRAYAEQRWLSREVVPVLREVEGRERVPEEQRTAALAYLEVVWLDALRHACAADAARLALDAQLPPERQAAHARRTPAQAAEDTRVELAARDAAEHSLLARARRYHDLVRALRDAVARRVTPLISLQAGAAPAHARR